MLTLASLSAICGNRAKSDAAFPVAIGGSYRMSGAIMTSHDAGFWVGPWSAPDTYQLGGALAGGGEGLVWRAIIPLSAAGRGEVAVKILPPDRRTRRRELGSFRSPAQSARTSGFGSGSRCLRRAGYASAGEANLNSSSRYVVMSYVDGANLRDWLIEHPELTVTQRMQLLRTRRRRWTKCIPGREPRCGGARRREPVNMIVAEMDRSSSSISALSVWPTLLGCRDAASLRRTRIAGKNGTGDT